MRILLIEDDKSLGRAVRDHLSMQNHAVDWVLNLADAQTVITTTPYSFILLDLRLPDGNGIDFLKTIRDNGGTVPVIILTAHDQISDRIEGLNGGADDYLVKPFDLYELSARLSAVVRRISGRAKSGITVNDMMIDTDLRRVFLGEKEIELSGREWTLLECFIRHPDKLVTRGEIEETIYAFGSEIESNTVEVYISRLRKKIGKERIKTHHGRGYSLC